MENTKLERVLEIFFRGLRGEDLSIQKMADEYEVSTKSITRSINDLKNFLADHRELVGYTDLKYSYQDRCYRLYMDEFLSSKELFSLVEVMIGARAFSKEELLELTGKAAAVYHTGGSLQAERVGSQGNLPLSGSQARLRQCAG